MIGAGVAGLTTAVCLAETGLGVTVQAGQPPGRTTSAVAGAIWGRHLVEDSDRVSRWCAESLEVLTALAAEPGTGIRLVGGIDAARAMYPRPDWAAPLADLRPCDPADLPAGFAAGWRYTAPVVSMPVYLDYLAGRLRRAGGQLTVAPLDSLAQAVRQRRRAGDRELHRGRGPRLRARPVGEAGPRPGRDRREPRHHRVLHRRPGPDPRADLRVPAR